MVTRTCLSEAKQKGTPASGQQLMSQRKCPNVPLGRPGAPGR